MDAYRSACKGQEKEEVGFEEYSPDGEANWHQSDEPDARAIRRMRAALGANDAAAAEKLAPETFSELDKAIQKRTLTENTANRYKSRLTLALNGLKAKKA